MTLNRKELKLIKNLMKTIFLFRQGFLIQISPNKTEAQEVLNYLRDSYQPLAILYTKNILGFLIKQDFSIIVQHKFYKKKYNQIACLVLKQIQ